MRLKIKLFMSVGLLSISFSSFAYLPSETCPNAVFMNNIHNRDPYDSRYIRNYQSIGTLLLSTDFNFPVSWARVVIVGGIVQCVYDEEGSGQVTATTMSGIWKPVNLRDWETNGSSFGCGYPYSFVPIEECRFN